MVVGPCVPASPSGILRVMTTLADRDVPAILAAFALGRVPGGGDSASRTIGQNHVP
jgi:hypothetical protein